MQMHKFEERLLSVNALSLTLGQNLILRDVNLHVDNVTRPGMDQGQVVAILGPSGIGKTQLFRCLAGLQRPNEGQVLIGVEQKIVMPGQVGIVFQNYPLMVHRTVKQNLMLAANNAGKPEKEAIELLKLFELDDKVDMFPAQLSGGQRQRISIIQQLLCSEHFILMDEPFSGLDVMSKQRMCDLITKITQVHEHTTIIVTTHEIETAITIADHLWVMGRERTKEGAIIPGARLIKEINLIDRGLAWNKDVRNAPKFRTTCDELYTLFKTL